MKRILIILTISLIGFTKGYSCKCYQMDLKNEIDYADLIFQGIPIDKNQHGSKMIYKFSVIKIWKGVKSDTFEIKTGFGGPDCGMIFEIGKEYLVFSQGGETTWCRRNSLMTETIDPMKLDYRFSEELSANSFEDSTITLNKYESKFLNEQFKNIITNFDFTNKAIIFTSNTQAITKKEWYNQFWIYNQPSVQLVNLTESERSNTGFDAILVTFSKKPINNKQKRRILNQIK